MSFSSFSSGSTLRVETNDSGPEWSPVEAWTGPRPRRQPRVRPRSPRSPQAEGFGTSQIPNRTMSQLAGRSATSGAWPPRTNSLPSLPYISVAPPLYSQAEDRLSAACGFAPSPLIHSCKSPLDPQFRSKSPLPPPPAANIQSLTERLSVLLERRLDIASFIIDRETDLAPAAQESRKPPSAATVSFPSVFGVPLNEIPTSAMTVTFWGGYQHDVPTVVYAAVEELYKTGIYQRGLFRDLPNRERHLKLIGRFDNGPSYGQDYSLHTQTMPDTCALLSSFLSSMGHPLLPPGLFASFYEWCILPSVTRADADQTPQKECLISPQMRWQLSRRSTSEYILLRGIEDEEETSQISIAQTLLRMIPTQNLSLLIYLFAFLTQIPLTPENGLTLEDIGNLFGVRLMGGTKLQARTMLVWILMRWHKISSTLFDDIPAPDVHPGSSDPLELRRCSTTTQDSMDSWMSSSSRGGYASTAATSVHSHDETLHPPLTPAHIQLDYKFGSPSPSLYIVSPYASVFSEGDLQASGPPTRQLRPPSPCPPIYERSLQASDEGMPSLSTDHDVKSLHKKPVSLELRDALDRIAFLERELERVAGKHAEDRQTINQKIGIVDTALSYFDDTSIRQCSDSNLEESESGRRYWTEGRHALRDIRAILSV